MFDSPDAAKKGSTSSKEEVRLLPGRQGREASRARHASWRPRHVLQQSPSSCYATRNRVTLGSRELFGVTSLRPRQRRSRIRWEDPRLEDAITDAWEEGGRYVRMRRGGGGG